VSLKFRIYSANLIQEFEEVHTTQTDSFGMVNVLIGSVSTGAFSSLVWDSKQKSLHVLVSFDQGGNYTKVSEQQLTYNPMALFAETAAKLSETLSIAGGGTGATTAAAARTNLGLGNVENTTDAAKPISTATQSALDTKVDKVTGKQLSTNDFSTAEKTKLAAITGTNTGDQDLSAYATTTQLATKASASDVTNSLATKVDKEVGKGLSSNDYTMAEKNKLAAISGDGTGIQGPAGLPGATGPQGPAGVAGPTGATGPQGPIGLTGPAGPQGPAGNNGSAGATGAVGPIGPAGATGAQGPQGLTGPAGAAGSNGKTVAYGTSNPNSSTGVDGDFYINTASNMLFGPKASGAWPTGVSLVGPTGAQGPQGLTGATGAAGAQGIQGLTGATGPAGVAGATGAQGPQGLTGATGAAGAQGIQGLTGATGPAGVAGATGPTGATGPAPSGTGIVTVSSGMLQTPGELTGDVTTTGVGLATSIATGAVTSAKLLDGTIATADVADAAITDAKIGGVAGSKVSGNISGNAANVTGTVAVGNGGTGATTLTSGALLKGNGTSAISAATAGTDYLAPNGSAASLTNFPTFNQNTTGNAANVTGTVAVANGGTGATTLAANNVLLGSGTSALQVVAPGNSGNVLTSNGTTWTSSAPSASGVPYSGAAGAVNLGSYELTSNGVKVGRGASSMANNYAYGYAVLSANTTGNFNNAFGHQALTANTTGQENNAFGEYVLPKNIGGNYNTAMGSNALKENTSGSGNTGFGRQALQTNSTGSNNTAIGHQANVSVDGLSNATAIGNGATVTASNTIQLGNSSVTNVNTSGAVTAPIYASTPQTLTDAGAISWNPSSGLNASVTLAGNRTLGFSTAPPTGAYGTLVVKQDGTGGRTLTLPSVANKILGSSSTTTIGLSTAANAIDIVNFYFDGTNYFWNVGQGYGTAATSSATNIAGGAAGSIPYQTAAGATSLLAKGSDGQILTLASGIPSWASAPATGVTSVAMTTPTGLSVSGSPITSSGTLALSMATGYAIPATTSQTNWDAAYSNRITSASSPLTISSNAISLGTVPVANGGTGATTLTANNVLLGNGTSALQVVAPGASGNVLTSNGSTWSSTALSIPAAVRLNSDEFTATAAQTVFTFTTTSSTTGAVQTPLSKPYMYINGIRIKNAAFTWTTGATAVTYVPANNNSYTLVAGDRITFDYAY
jgi:hypothetical protein